jgi:hypothetical protein
VNASSRELRELTADELEDVTGAARGNLAGLLRNLGKQAMSSIQPRGASGYWSGTDEVGGERA